MIVLALDTCLSACSVAVTRGERTLAAISEPMVRGHQERLGSMVREAMDQAQLEFGAVERIGVTVGPGSFTGLRVGLAFAKGLALALDIPCVGVGSLEALGAQTTGHAVAIADARREQAYWQAFIYGDPAGPPTASAVEAAAAHLRKTAGPLTLIGPGAGLLAEHFPDAQRLDLGGPDPEMIARVAARRPEPLPPPEPIYLRGADAKLPGGLSLSA